MTKVELKYLPGQTPLDLNELNGLIPKYISSQGQLNELESSNIADARLWAFQKKTLIVLDEIFLRNLHKRMFKNVWKWAGKYRDSDKNIGVPKENIRTEIQKLVENTKYWIENKTYDWDEIGARFHHKLVWIHCFANGNGRHARLMTDVLLKQNNVSAFTWGNKLVSDVKIREQYILALKEADKKNLKALIKFVRQ